ncbi:putative bifunctional diguanylate cyclase/phosphodiesterase [Pacificoceanicola onchidii]|uniref:putative bifunctional diguanylate cyclase/phosphodiesterase n=1 Tax=Pacificoceanicola onchidii TaxID=2562685 RepID=UPI0010A3C4B5|nr:EAL domain-containing protein [Pacificoceanicola onchidii]
MIDDRAFSAFRQFFAEAKTAAWLASEDGDIIVVNAAFVWQHQLDVPAMTRLASPQILSADVRTRLQRIAASHDPQTASRPAPMLHIGSEQVRYAVRRLQSEDSAPVFLGQEQARAVATRDADAYMIRDGRAYQRLKQLVDNAPSALFEFRQAPGRRYSLPYFSEKLPLLLGVEATALRKDGASLLQTVIAEDAIPVLKAMAQSKRDLSDFHRQIRIQHPQHGTRWLMCSATPAPEQDGAITWFANVIDVTERVLARRAAVEASQALEQAHRKLTTIADNAPAGIFELYRDATRRGVLRYCSGHLLDLLGLEADEADRFWHRVRDCMRPADFAALNASMEASLTEGGHWSHRFRFKHPERGVLWLSGSATSQVLEDGAAVWIGTVHDVTPDMRREQDLRRANKRAEAMRSRSEWQAFHDALTRLANRRYFDKTLDDRVREARRAAAPLPCTLIRIDCDRFKHINDTLGHDVGDEVLRQIARTIRKTLREEDLAARIGGDEFAVLLASDANERSAQARVGEIQALLAEPFEQAGHRCQIEASFGIAHVENLADVGPDVLYFADAALFRAKELGRNRTELFTPSLQSEILADRQTATDLQLALTRDEFVPFFQPQVCARTGALCGVETLLRWQHPEHGILGPDRFLKVAEQMRIVPELDSIMLEKACGLLSKWRGQNINVPKIGFNVSSGRMRDPTILAGAERILQGGTRVAFELLESILIEEEGDLFRFHLDQLRERGIEIEIDDFGSGHASIVALMEIHPHALKIDRRVIRPVTEGARYRRLVQAIVEIAECFGLSVTAEGVETEDHVAALRKIGCTVLQGYHFSKPLSPDDLVAFVRARGETGEAKIQPG